MSLTTVRPFVTWNTQKHQKPYHTLQLLSFLSIKSSVTKSKLENFIHHLPCHMLSDQIQSPMLTLQTSYLVVHQSKRGAEQRLGWSSESASWFLSRSAPLQTAFYTILPASLQLALTSRQQQKQLSVSSGHRRVTAPQPWLSPSKAPPLSSRITFGGVRWNGRRSVAERWRAQLSGDAQTARITVIRKIIKLATSK